MTSQEKSRTRSQSTTQQAKFTEAATTSVGSKKTSISLRNMADTGLKSGSVHLKPLNYLSTKTNSNAPAMTRQDESGILEERGESTCSSKYPKNELFSDGGGNSSMYPRLKEQSVPENRNSCQIIETVGAKRLEASDKLKMPSVSTAVAQRRARKGTESLKDNNNYPKFKAPPAITGHSHISES